MTSTNDIRRSFLDYFEGHGHARVPSAPLVPHNDPTLMFVNAGMVPFKNVFTGLETRPYTTAASSQKCVRAGGKHNDLDNVGYTARHHTFFEMLGNFSFGDYFKEQAITHAWTLLTKEWGLPAHKLTATVYHTDDQAFDLWKKIAGLPEERIIRIATKDNFWAMGSDGPCGPCSEIFYDHGDHIWGGPPGSPEEDGDRFVEIWNLVFMQYVQEADTIIGELPKPSIDTGMGLERVAAVLQGVHDNYDTDTFKALIAESGALTHSATTGDNQASHRVIADHIRTSGFLVADGVLPANEGRGYVLRRIMRRAMRHAHILGAKEPLMHRMVPSLVAEMGGAYPELVRAQPLIEATLLQEETRFRQTLANGLKLLDEATGSMGEGDTLPGETAFKLYDTYGFPYDLTEDALRPQGMKVDRDGFDTAMKRQKDAARAAWKGSGAKASDDVWFDIAEELGSTEFTGYSATEGEGQVVALVKDGVRVDRAGAGDEVTILTNQTPFYGESGGQMGDAGTIGNDNAEAIVSDTSKPLGRLHAHQATLARGEIKVGDTVKLAIDVSRRDAIRANHSATHLVHAALRNRLGGHVTQKGSLVAPDRFRFDFSHPTALSAQEIADVEAEVNAEIRANETVGTRLMTPDDAVAAGALALFGEKYGDEVRVLSMGRLTDKHYSVELCGGTHVRATGDIGVFKIVSESAVAGGVRRIEALTGEAARSWLNDRDAKLREVAATLKTSPDEVSARVAALVEERRKLERELAEAKKALALGGGGAAAPAGPEQIGGVNFVGQILDGLDPKALRGAVDEAKGRIGSAVVAFVAVNEGRAAIAVGVTDDLTGTFSAVELVKRGVAALGGQGGGGRPDMAQGGGPEGGNAQAAIDAVKTALAEEKEAA
ncbi:MULTISPECIES: alanine--tRNA ligase [unclassified Sphingomonas]|uniref:alanine--tRNA ligase n=1 Tax=unclassified Sphingomonas TaxID=196159 RepID=UPI002150BBF7|nr:MULTISPECIES: alanine--tRNA ligase [unclassified Sphingomonas]MCR5872321.1 alanine--tRNA ligase [Sphingomonas sp. J344]UUX99384.1 alanine--tRNA ligase [Sphingomonas sp. J315]